MHCYTKCAGNMILKSGHFCFSWIDNAISCGKGIELDAEGRLHQESLGCEDSVRQTDEHTCICSMVHLLKMVRNVCAPHLCELCLRCQQRLFTIILCPVPRHTGPNWGWGMHLHSSTDNLW